MVKTPSYARIHARKDNDVRKYPWPIYAVYEYGRSRLYLKLPPRASIRVFHNIRPSCEYPWSIVSEAAVLREYPGHFEGGLQ